jgi:hypothetical protein
MDDYVSLALNVEERGSEMLAELNAIRNNRYARKAKSLLLGLMADANRALEARCPDDLDSFAGLDAEDDKQGAPSEACCRRCAEDAWRETQGSAPGILCPAKCCRD